MTTTLYFAYGSNMAVERLKARVPSARAYNKARLPGYELKFHKKGADGSAKCDVVVSGDHNSEVQGVVFEFNLDEKPILDVFEGPRYESHPVELITAGDQMIEAFLYVVADKAAHTDQHLKPFHWYKHHVLFGARQAALPESYIAGIAAVEAMQDPDKERTRRELSIYAGVELPDLLTDI